MTQPGPPSGRDSDTPPCFATLEIVFPLGKDGLRSTPEACFACEHKTFCLRAALEGPEGWKVREEFSRRSHRSGMISFLQRWSRKKDIQRKLKNKGGRGEEH